MSQASNRAANPEHCASSDSAPRPSQAVAKRAGNATLRAGVILSGLVLAATATPAPGLAEPQATSPTNGTGASSGSSALLGLNCAPGSQLLSITSGVSYCPTGTDAVFPPCPLGTPACGTCFGDSTGGQTFWGTTVPGGVPIFLDLPQFNPLDPAINAPGATLVEAKLKVTSETFGTICFENLAAQCCVIPLLANPTASFLTNDLIPGTFLPAGNSVIQNSNQVQVSWPAFSANNGIQNCGVGGPESTGACGDGNDYKVFPFNTSVDNEISVTDPALLANWTGNGIVTFGSDFLDGGLMPTSQCLSLAVIPDIVGRVHAEVTYTYCTNAPPTCAPDVPVIQVNEDEPVDINLLNYVFDVDSCLDCSTFVPGMVSPSNGTLSPFPSSIAVGQNPTMGLDGCGSCDDVVTYTPDPDFCGLDSFSFEVQDEHGQSVECTVNIRVNPVNDPPVCDTPTKPLQTLEDTPIEINFCDFVSDIDEVNGCGDGIDCNSIGTPVSDCGGTFTSLGGGVYRFLPPLDFCGQCTITFSASDSGSPPLSTGECQLTVEVLPVNDPPMCNTPGGPPMTILEDQTMVLNLSDFVMDPDAGNNCGGATLDCNTLTFSTSNPALVVTPGPGPCEVTVGGQPGQCGGPFSLFFNISDSAGRSIPQDCELRFRITPVNEPPICNPNPPNLAVNEDTPVVFDICNYVIDPDEATGCGDPIDPATLSNLSSSCGGVVESLGGCQVRFTPPENYCGPCSIDFTICDEGGECVTCTINFVIRPVNDRPECTNLPTKPIEVLEGGSVDIDFAQFVTDIDDENGCGGGLDLGSIMPMLGDCEGSFQPVAGPGNEGVFTYTPALGFCGPCTITFTASDLGNPPLSVELPCPIPVLVIGVNQPPVAVDDTAITDEDTPVVIDVIANDSDPDDGGPEGCGCMLDSSTIEITSFDPACAQSEPTPFFSNRLGRWAVRFTPVPDYCGPCVFTYRVSDTDTNGVICSTSNEATVTVTINPVNDPPVAMDDSATTFVGQPVLIDLCANDSDIDDETGCGCTLDCSTIMVVDGDPNCGTLEPDPQGSGQWVYTPAPDFEGDCCFTYRIYDTDGGGNLCDFDEAEVCITVNRDCPPTNHRNPGSLLIFPEFDNREGMLTIHTVTNTNAFEETRVKLEYVDAENCTRMDRSVLLTPDDTFTFFTDAYFADQVHGYAYMFATCNQTGPAVVFNHLIGSCLVVDGFDGIAYSLNAISFRGVGMDASGNTAGNGPCDRLLTDLDDDGNRDLDNVEYEGVPDEILIPRFIGQNDVRSSELILIALTGGREFSTTLDFLIYNDNEQVFSSQYTFDCWERTPLTDVTNLFRNEFLQNNTNNDPEEILGSPEAESGWIRIDGRSANSSSTSIPDPAFYAILVEKNDEYQMAADLPWHTCTQLNGSLLPKTLNGE